MRDLVTLMTPAALASLVMSPVHCLFGLHIVRRGVIFIDLAVAQVAALGAAFALLMGSEPGSTHAYVMSLAFGLFGALLVSATRFKLRTVPHEAIIGIIYVVGSACTIIALNRTAHGLEEMQNMLIGNIFTVSMEMVRETAIIYAVVLVVLLTLWRRFHAATEAKSESGFQSVAVDFIFYGLLAFVVASSVKLAGFLLVFTWLVMPPVAILLWMDNLTKAAFFAVPSAMVVSVAGLVAAYYLDSPVGAMMVVTFGIFVTVLYVAKLIAPSRDPKSFGVGEFPNAGD
ncbi:MAG: metal ABC transporter permease [Fimbriimonadales bacterium]